MINATKLIVILFWITALNINAQECPTTQSFSATGDYIVPTDAAEITITLKGADGGNNEDKFGGSGASMTATFPVTAEGTIKPGSTIKFIIGQVGSSTTTTAGAGGGGASIAIVDGTSYPLIIAGGGGGAGGEDGEGGSADRYPATSDENGGSQAVGGGGGGGAGADVPFDGDLQNGANGLNQATGSGTPAIGGSGHTIILTGTGGNGGKSFNDGSSGGAGGTGGGGAGGNRGSFAGLQPGGGGGGGGYNGGNGAIGGSSGTAYGGSSYIYDGNLSNNGIAGSVGESEGLDGNATVCYISNASKNTCDGSTEQINNSTFSQFGNIETKDQTGATLGADLFENMDAICFEGWDRSVEWENAGGSSNNAAFCTEASMNSASGNLSQTVGNICNGQKLEFCFDFRGTWVSGTTTNMTVSIGGQEYLTIQMLGSILDQADGPQYVVGSDSNEVTATDISDNTPLPSTYLQTGNNVRFCIVDENYSGSIPAKILFSPTQTENTPGSGFNSLTLDDISLTYSNMGAPLLQDTTNFAEKPGSCEGTFDLTSMNPTTIPSGLTLTWKDSDNNVVVDPTMAETGSYKACYTRTSGSCGGSCVDEVCTDVFNVVCSLVPVVLSKFNITTQNNDALLTWTTESESNNKHFEIEKSLDGTVFRRIGTVDGKGTILQSNSYEYTDKDGLLSKGSIYYRLKQMDYDGKFEYSPVIAIRAKQSKINVFPNPVTDNELFIKNASNNDSFIIYDMMGKIVIKGSVTPSIDVSQLANGSYILKIKDQHKNIIYNDVLIK